MVMTFTWFGGDPRKANCEVIFHHNTVFSTECPVTELTHSFRGLRSGSGRMSGRDRYADGRGSARCVTERSGPETARGRARGVSG